MTPRPIRWGMIGGGEGAFIGGVHRMAARLDGQFAFLAAAPSSTPERARRSGALLGLDPDRTYDSVESLITGERGREDGVEVISIVTPNALHFAQTKACLEAGFHVICDKPLTTTPEDARALEHLSRSRNLLLGVTFTYSGYPLMRHARSLIADGRLGEIRIVHISYLQDWLSTPLETENHKQAAWRADPAQAGQAGCLGDIGMHAAQLAEFVTGLQIESVAADLTACVPGRVLDDTAHMMLRFGGGARGLLCASQVVHGKQNGLVIRIAGERGSVEWAQETPDHLVLSMAGEAPALIRRGDVVIGAAGQHATRLPGGHPEGFIEAFAQLYRDYAERIRAHQEGRTPPALALDAPDVRTGVRSASFVRAALASNAAEGRWEKLGDQ